MADTFKRLSNLIKGMGSEWMNKMEADNPDAVVRSAVEGARGRYDQVVKQIGRLKAEDKGAGDERARVEKELGELRAQRRGVDDASELAARLDEAIQRMAARLETLDTEAEQRDALSAELTTRAQELRREVDAIKAEGDSLVARSVVARDVTAQQSFEAGAPSRAYERALQSVRDSADQARRAADQGLPSDAELGRLKAEARLAALKAMRKAPEAPAAAAPEGSAPSGEEEAPKPPSPLPDRDL